ncbi:hypothetical protein, partial [Klebsiella pneumoniae]|uniref:hypothetical protein n=1 Tax=Klebsiella pneumoniae TaxID=573 RepID=UPI0030135D76
ANLDMHQYLRVSELGMPDGVKVMDDPERVVVGVTHARAEILPEVAAPPTEDVAAPAEPEVIARGKKPEEE